MKHKPNDLTRHYSGNHSKRFWDRVNALDHAAYQDGAYIMGCALQEFELRVIQFVENAEKIIAAREIGPQRKMKGRT